MAEYIKLGNKKIYDCENCGCRFSYNEECIKDLKICCEDQVKAIIPYVECPRCGTPHKVRKGVVEE